MDADAAAAIPDVLRDCLSFLFPRSTPPRLERSRRRDSRSWIPLPATHPRALVPSHPARATATAIRRDSTAVPGVLRTARRGASSALALGAAAAYPARLVVDDLGSGGFADHLSDLLGEEVVLALSVGRPRANLKLIVQALGPDGRSLAFVKIGHPLSARAHVEREQRALTELGDRGFDRLRIPRVLATDTWQGAPVLVLTSLDPPARRVRTTRDLVPLPAMEELSRALGGEQRPLADLPGWRRLRAQAGEGPTSDRLQVATDVLHERHGDLVLTESVWHGDWTPWNMMWGRDEICLWDWERFERGVPPWFDAFHYAVFSAADLHGLTVPQLETRLALARQQLPLDPLRSHALGQLYLLWLAARHHQGTGQFSRIARRQAEVLLDALERSTAGTR